MKHRWYLPKLGLFVGIILFLAGCEKVLIPTEFDTEPTFTPTILPTITPMVKPVTKILLPTETIAPTEAMGVTPTLPLPAQSIFLICSPLARETIPELSEIVSDPYKPPLPERAEERHHGVDFSHYNRKGYSGIEGEPVQSILPGIVAASINNRLPYGNMVIIETNYSTVPSDFAQAIELQAGHSVYVLYAHLRQAPEVNLGEAVTCGQVLGEVGAIGYNVVNAHLHLETRSGLPGQDFPSMAFYTTTASRAEMQNYTRWRTGGEFQHFDPMLLFQQYLVWSSTPFP